VTSAVELSLITGGFTAGAVAITFAGNMALDMVRDRRSARLARDAAIADLQTASSELALAVENIRTAYRRNFSDHLVYERTLDAITLVHQLWPIESSWKSVAAGRSFWEKLLHVISQEAIEQNARSRTIALDYAAMIGPQVARFFAAAVAAPLARDEALSLAASNVAVAGTALLRSVTAPKRKYAVAQRRFREKVGDFEVAAGRRRQPNADDAGQHFVDYPEVR